MRLRALVTGLALVLAGGACGGHHPGARRSPARAGDAVTVGSFAFAENETLAEIYAQALERRGRRVRRALRLASREVVEPALEQGRLDLVPEYVGTALTFLRQGSPSPADGAQAYEQLRSALADRRLRALAPAPAEDKNGVVVTRGTADRLGLRTVSDLAPVAPTLVFGGPPECPERPLCLPGLRRVYGLSFKQYRPLDASGPRTVAALQGGEIDVALLFTTDPHLGDDVVLLDDDRHLQPAENVVPVLRADVADRHGPALSALIDSVSAQLHTDDLIALNRRVEVDHASSRSAAAEWLDRHPPG